MHLERHPRAVLLAILVLATSSAAQTYVSSPPGYLSLEAPSWATQFGAYPGARHMMFDGELRNMSGTIKEVAYRADYAPFQPRNGMGRRWSSVTLKMAECDMDALSPVFLSNLRSTPTQVFAGSVTWPTRSGVPTNLPTRWSIVFPFTVGWTYGGTKDILLDFDFNGGMLTNSGTWDEADARDYQLDAYPTDTVVHNTSFFHGAAGPGTGCVDGGGVGHGGINFLHINGYNSNHPDPTLRNKFELYSFSYFTAAGKPVANIVNFVGDPAGFTFPGVTCNKLYLNANKYRMVGVSIASGPGNWSGFIYPPGIPNGLVPYNSAYEGLSMWAQAYWNDSKTGAVRLSRAVSTHIPWVPVATRRSSLHQYLKVIKDSLGYGPFTDEAYNPVIRYAL